MSTYQLGFPEGEGLRGEAPAELLSLLGRSKSGLTTREGVAETLHPCPAISSAFVVVVPVIGRGRRLRINGTSSSSSSSLDDSCTTKSRALGPGFSVLIFPETGKMVPLVEVRPGLSVWLALVVAPVLVHFCGVSSVALVIRFLPTSTGSSFFFPDFFRDELGTSCIALCTAMGFVCSQYFNIWVKTGAHLLLATYSRLIAFNSRFKFENTNLAQSTRPLSFSALAITTRSSKLA